jgi:hypothetical protein
VGIGRDREASPMAERDISLKSLLGHFSFVAEEKNLITVQLDELETVMKPVRLGHEEFSTKHLKTLESDIGFFSWWRVPEIGEDELASLRGLFRRLRTLDEDAIGTLQSILKNIEIVSVILRCMDPMNYGIISAPVENLLNIQGHTQENKYIGYLRNLGELRDEYGFERIADVDMALWTLANILNSTTLRHHSVYGEFYQDYLDSPNAIKKIRARNSLQQISDEKPLFKAELFLDTDYELAGIIAGRELERNVKAYCRKVGVELFTRKHKGEIHFLYVPELLDRLTEIRRLSSEESDKAKGWWQSRTELTHKDKHSVKQEDVRQMIEGVAGWMKKYPAAER